MGDLHLNGKEFNFDANTSISKDDLKSNNVNIDKLETLFMEYDGIKLANGISANEARTIINLFDENKDNNIVDSELTDEKIKKFIEQNGGNVNDSTLVSSLKDMLKAITSTFASNNTTGPTAEKDGYTLETKNGVTKKTHYNADGTKNNRIAEQWEAGFKNYRKEWTGPNGERTLLEGTSVKDNGDGTYTLTVKRTDSRYPDTTFEMVFDSNGKELSRKDMQGKEYDSQGNLLTDETPAADECPKGEEKSVVVESYGKGVKNSTLSGIITNAYDVKYGTDEYFAIEKMVMDANPDIYGDANGNGGRKRIIDGTRHNAVIHPGDTIKLPPYDGKTATPAEPSAPAANDNPAPAADGSSATFRKKPVDPRGPVEAAAPEDDPVDATPEEGEKVVTNADGTVTVTTVGKTRTGEPVTTEIKYSDASRSKVLSEKTTYSTFTKIKEYTYSGDKLKQMVERSNAGGSWSSVTYQYDNKENLRSKTYSVNGYVEFFGEYGKFVDDFKKGDKNAYLPEGLSVSELSYIIKDCAKIAKSKYGADDFASKMNRLLDKVHTRKDYNNLCNTYRVYVGETYGTTLANSGTSAVYIKEYLKKLSLYGSDNGKSYVNSVNTDKVIEDNKFKRHKGFMGVGYNDKKTLEEIYDKCAKGKISLHEAIAVMNKLYPSILAEGITNTGDKDLERKILQLFESVYFVGKESI